MSMNNTSTHTSTCYRIQQQVKVNYDYPVIFGNDFLNVENEILANIIDNHDESPKILPVFDQGLLDASPILAQQIVKYFQHHQINVLPPLVVAGGEACKSSSAVIDTVYQAVEEHAIDRHSYILVMGGGAVTDAIGYAAATAHRGIRLIRMPSTVLGQNDAGIGVKNSINYHNRKNYIGSFAPPFAVLNDFDLLDTLTDRDKRAGISEAVKVALIKDKQFFDELYQARDKLALFESNTMQNMIINGAKWHLNHIATSGDPFELGSARPLDFGHWSAHKLEELTHNELRHGEAVAIGIAIDSLYSELTGYLSADEVNKVLVLLSTLGFELNHPVLDMLSVSQALAEFKEHLGGNLTITLLSQIGTGFEIHDINEALMIEAIERLKEHCSDYASNSGSETSS